MSVNGIRTGKANSEIANTKAVYDAIAHDHAEKYFNPDASLKESLQIKYDKFVGCCRKGSLVLDAGCGSGRDAKFLASAGYTVIGVDYSKGMIAEARTRVPEVGFAEADLLKMPFKSGTFDAIWANASVLHVPRSMCASVISEFNRVLKRNGIIFLSLNKGSGEGAGSDGRFFARYEEPELTKVLKEGGFGILETYQKERGLESGEKLVELNVFAQSRSALKASLRG